MDIFDAENEFYRNCDVSRIGKFLAHAKLYEQSLQLPGDFVEVGVFKGASFSRFRKFGRLFHPDFGRRFIGFDVFGPFPDADYEPDREMLDKQKQIDGGVSISDDELLDILSRQGLTENVELVKGDIRETLTPYFEAHADRVIAITNIDVDLYEPTKVALDVIFPRVVPGGVIIIDDYASGYPGANKAVEEYLAENNRSERLQKFPFTHTPCYLVKERQ